jgi:hypothetical protein
MRSITAAFPIYKFWELPKGVQYRALNAIIDILPRVPGEEIYAKVSREHQIKNWMEKQEFTMLTVEQCTYYEQAEFFMDGELYVEGITWQPKQVKMLATPQSAQISNANANAIARWLNNK